MRVATALKALTGSLMALSLTAVPQASADPLAASSLYYTRTDADWLYPAEAQTVEVRARTRAMSAFRWKRQKKESAFRPRRIALLRYDQPLQVGQQDLLLRLRAPGKGKTWASLEVRF